MKEYRNKVTLVSLLLSVSVVLSHSVDLGGLSIIPWGLEAAMGWIRTFVGFALVCFFALSGYLFYQNYEPALLGYKLRSRVHSLLIPYLLWNLLGYLYFQVLHALPFISSRMNGTMEPFSLGGLLHSVIFGDHNSLWFVRKLMIYVLLTPVLYSLLRRKSLGIVSLILLAALGIASGRRGYVWYLSAYGLGAYMGLHHRELVQQHVSGRWRLIGGIVLLVSVTAASRMGLLNEPWVLLLWAGVLPFGWIAADVLAVKWEPAWWMRHSFLIYCAHSMILEAVEKLFYLAAGRNWIWAGWADLLLCPGVTLGLIFLLAWVLRKIPPLYDLLTGGRGK